MSREILFRGKRLDNKQWVYGFFWKDIWGGGESCYIYYDTTDYPVDPATVGQYTGLDDTFGNRVFEGDILKLTHDWYDGDSDVWYAIVEFGNPNGLYSWGWQLRRIAGTRYFSPDILLWLGEGLEETGVTSQVLSEMQALEATKKGGMKDD